MKQFVRLRSAGACCVVTIPSSMVVALGLTPGDQLLIEETGHGITLTPQDEAGSSRSVDDPEAQESYNVLCRVVARDPLAMTQQVLHDMRRLKQYLSGLRGNALKEQIRRDIEAIREGATAPLRLRAGDPE